MPRWSFLVLALTACKASLPANMCPGGPPPRCMTKLECSVDEARGCQVCRCAAPPYARPEETPPK